MIKTKKTTIISPKMGSTISEIENWNVAARVSNTNQRTPRMGKIYSQLKRLSGLPSLDCDVSYSSSESICSMKYLSARADCADLLEHRFYASSCRPLERWPTYVVSYYSSNSPLAQPCRPRCQIKNGLNGLWQEKFSWESPIH